jgi:hypothetical protein
MKSLGSAAAKVAAPILGRRGFGEAQMILEWAAIVGQGLASDTQPVKLSFARGARVDGTLHLRVTGGAAPAVSHLAPVLIERINGFFGYRAVARLALRQGPIAQPPGTQRPPPPAPLTPGEEIRLEAAVASIEDPDLRAALARLGRSVIGDSAALHRR